jgi:hypothetical protein
MLDALYFFVTNDDSFFRMFCATNEDKMHTLMSFATLMCLILGT